MKKSKVKVPTGSETTLDNWGITDSGVTVFKNANPYSIYNGFINSGFDVYSYKFKDSNSDNYISLSEYIGEADPPTFMLANTD